MKYLTFFLLVSLFVLSCQLKNGQALKSISDETKIDAANTSSLPYIINVYGDTIYKISKSEDEWKSMLSESEFYVLRKKGTERAFTGDLLKNKDEGLYTCRGCGIPLFASKHKFDSGTGWPSYYDVVDKNMVHEDTDYDLGYPRTELTCAKCGGHLGHVFNDGPKPTGLRYCINSVSLDFVKSEN